MFVCTKTFRDRNNRVLETGRHTVADDFTERSAIEADFADMKTILFLRPQQMDHAENRACELGNDRCKRRRTDPHAKPSDKKQVEHNIDARRYDQIDQRVTAVANGLQDADENVIHDKTKRSCKIGTEIFDGLRQDIGRCSHQHKDFRRQIHAKHSQRYTGRQAERHGRMDRFLQIFPVFPLRNTLQSRHRRPLRYR